MEKERYTFRLSPETIQQLDELIEKGAIQNRTEGVIKGIALLHASELYKGPVHDLVFTETRSPELIRDLEKFPDGAEIPFYGGQGVKITITKIGPEHIQLVKECGGEVIRKEVEIKKGPGVQSISI